MKALDPRAAEVFLRLADGLTPSEERRVDNSGGRYTPLRVERLSERLYSLAQWQRINGDLVADPDVEFYVTAAPDDPTRKAVYPTAVDHGHVGVPERYARSVDFEEDRPVRVNRAAQARLVEFCRLWMENIRFQQGL